MSGPQAGREQAQSGFWARCHGLSAFLLFLWESLLWLGAFVALPLLIAYFVYLLSEAVLKPPSWYYSVSARSEAAALSLPAELETSWRIEGATLCSSVALDQLAAYASSESPCGSRRWQAYTLTQTQEQVLVLGGAATGPGRSIEVSMETRADRGLQMSIRGSRDMQSLGMLHLVDQGMEITLGPQLNLIWPADARPRDLVFPFTANRVKVGRDVTWSDSSLLHEGRMEIFAASDESLSKRTRVEEASLLPGDQIRLDRFGGSTPLHPKGFLRFDRLQPGESPSALTAVAFGRAERVRIERFGDSGYDFQPPWWAGASQNHTLVIISGLIGGLLGLLGGYAAIRDIHARSPHLAWKDYQERCSDHEVPHA